MIYDVHQYIFSARVFIQLLGLIYFFAFSAFIPQIKGLIGKDGILPVETFIHLVRLRYKRKSYYYLPSLFWICATDSALLGVVIAGTACSLLLIFGIFPPLMLFLLYLLYISIVSMGQDFLSFGWEMFLLEITANAFFLSWTEVPNPFIWISLNLLLFRFHFQAGIVKFQSKDRTWANFTALSYHYLSQPIPNIQAWFFHKFPMWFHKVSCFFMFFAELIIPFLMFGTKEMRLIAFLFLIGLQFFIWFTGNFSYLNHMTIVLCLVLISDSYWSFLVGDIPKAKDSPFILSTFLSIIGCFFISIQLIRFYVHFIGNPLFAKVLNWVSPFHIANRYGIFAIMTTKRYEIIIEGSDDREVWKEYTFKHKPGELDRRPRRISPFQPRLDWQAWFLPFSMYYTEPWFQHFLTRLLEGSPTVLKLLKTNPFPEKPPRYIRALMYDYTYTDFHTLRTTGRWWNREYVGHYSPTLFIKENL